MPLFVILGNWTQKRMETIKDLPENVKKGRQVFESYGVKLTSMVFTMGRYDLVAHMEAPTLEELARIISDKIRGVPGVLSTETLIIGF